MSKADDKRWAILPPPSVTSAALSGQFGVALEHGRRRPVRRTPEAGVEKSDAAPLVSQVNELEPADSERVTEVPPESRQRFSDSNLETIPAPAWAESEE